MVNITGLLSASIEYKYNINITVLYKMAANENV